MLGSFYQPRVLAHGNQILHYTCCIMPNRVTSAYIRVIAPAGNTALFEETLQRWRAVGNSVSDLAGPRFKSQTSRFRDEPVIVRRLRAVILHEFSSFLQLHGKRQSLEFLRVYTRDL